MKSTWPYNCPSVVKPYLKQGICPKCWVVWYHYKLSQNIVETTEPLWNSSIIEDLHQLHSPLHSHQLCVQVQNSVKRSKCLVVAKCLHKYTHTIYKYIYWFIIVETLFLYKIPSWTWIRTQIWGLCTFFKTGIRQKCSSCLKRYLGVQLLLCICVFSDVSRSFCSTRNNPEGRTVVAPGVWCVCLFMWKMFYVLFIPSGNDDDDDDSQLNNRTLINLSPKPRCSYLPFYLDSSCEMKWVICGVKYAKHKGYKIHEPTEHLSYIFIQHVTALIATPAWTQSSACICKLSIWLTTNTVSGVQQLFSGEIWCRQRVNSSIQRLLGLVCPNAPMGKESPIH